MAKDRLSGTLAVILHADVASSTALVQQDEQLAHERIQETFRLFSDVIGKYLGRVHELRGDALLAEFERPSDAVAAALSFQADHAYHNSRIKDDLRPTVRVGIAMGEVIVADSTVTGAGVVLAQRVEQLAVPGGLCITEALHEALPKRMPFNLENLGEQVLKGFDDPVRVYRVELRSGESIPQPEKSSQPATPPEKRRLMLALVAIALIVAGGASYWFKSQVPQEEPALLERMALPLPDKPSIAVLPFTNMSDNSEQEYFVDGMTEDLITDLSKLSGLFVVARNSVFTYKGRNVKVREVAEDLGVRYVLEGSVRRSGDQVRINAQLIDALSGGHVWAERYDGVLSNVFKLQDDVTRRIVEKLALNMSLEDSALGQSEAAYSEAYDLFLKGWGFYRSGTAKDYASAIKFYEKALDADPNFDHALAALAAVYWNILRAGWYQESLGIPYYSAAELARLSMQRSQKNPTALTHQIASESIAFYSSSPRRALAEAELALKLDPNHPGGHLAMANALLKANKPGEAEQAVRAAMRLDPHYPAAYLVKLAQAQFHLADYPAAAESLEIATARNPDDSWALVYLAATYGQLNLIEKGREALSTADSLRYKSGWGPITLVGASHRRFRWQGKRGALKDGLRVVGAPGGGEWYKLIIGKSEAREVKGATTVDASEAKALHERGALFVETYISGLSQRIPGAHFLEWWDGEGWLFNEAALGQLAAMDNEIVIYDTSGGRGSALAASALAVSRGFKNIYYFAGGADAWKAAGYPVEADQK